MKFRRLSSLFRVGFALIVSLNLAQRELSFEFYGDAPFVGADPCRHVVGYGLAVLGEVESQVARLPFLLVGGDGAQALVDYGQLFDVGSGEHVDPDRLADFHVGKVEHPEIVEHRQHVDRRPGGVEHGVGSAYRPVVFPAEPGDESCHLVAVSAVDHLVVLISSAFVGALVVDFGQTRGAEHGGFQSVADLEHLVGPWKRPRRHSGVVVFAVASERQHGRRGVFVDESPLI